MAAVSSLGIVALKVGFVLPKSRKYTNAPTPNNPKKSSTKVLFDIQKEKYYLDLILFNYYLNYFNLSFIIRMIKLKRMWLGV